MLWAPVAASSSGVPAFSRRLVEIPFAKPKWYENPLGVIPCRFDSDRPHHELFFTQRA